MFEQEMLSPDEKRRFHTVMVSIVVSAVLMTAVVTLAVGWGVPEWGWASAFGLGLMTGIWISPLVGSVAGNGIHEIRKERHEVDTAPASTESEGELLEAA